jgi:hypothetical protein
MSADECPGESAVGKQCVADWVKQRRELGLPDPSEKGKSADPGAGAASSVTATATGAPSASASPSSAIAAASAPSATPKPDKVLVTLTGAPPKAQVFRGKELVGEASAPVELPYGASPVELTVKAPGYKPHTLTVTPDKDAPVAVAMERAPSGGLAPTGTGTTIHKDLEQFH